MNFGLKDFFMGVVHLFVIFLPGSLLALIILVEFSEMIDVVKPPHISWTGLTLLFIGISYFLGHLVSLFASAIEDAASSRIWENPDTQIDPNSQTRLSVEKIKAFRTEREGGRELRKNALKICRKELNKSLVCDGSLRRWAQHLVRHRDAGMRAEIDAKDADRRFFRNIRWVLITLVTLVVTSLPNEKISWVEVAALVIVTALAWLRYYDQNWKFTKLVFESLIVLNAAAKKRH